MQSYGNLPNWQIYYAPFTFFNKQPCLVTIQQITVMPNPTLSRKGAKILI